VNGDRACLPDGLLSCHVALEAFATMAVFRSRIWVAESALAATVFLPEHCSSFCFLVQKIVQKIINYTQNVRVAKYNKTVQLVFDFIYI
jgi:hypothetical protein